MRKAHVSAVLITVLLLSFAFAIIPKASATSYLQTSTQIAATVGSTWSMQKTAFSMIYGTYVVDTSALTVNTTSGAPACKLYVGKFNSSTCFDYGIGISLNAGATDYYYFKTVTNATGSLVDTNLASAADGNWDEATENLTITINADGATVKLDGVVLGVVEDVPVASQTYNGFMFQSSGTASTAPFTAGYLTVTMKADASGSLTVYLPIIIVFVAVGALIGAVKIKRG